jgi:hypothetical protein
MPVQPPVEVLQVDQPNPAQPSAAAAATEAKQDPTKKSRRQTATTAEGSDRCRPGPMPIPGERGSSDIRVAAAGARGSPKDDRSLFVGGRRRQDGNQLLSTAVVTQLLTQGEDAHEHHFI